MVAGLSRLPESANENLTYRVTWTEGEDGVRAEGEAMMVMTVPMTFEPEGFDRRFCGHCRRRVFPADG